MAALEAEDLAEAEADAPAEQRDAPVAGRESVGELPHLGDAVGRSGARSTPAPSTRHGFRTMSSSATAVFRIARRSRYAFATVGAPT